MNAISSLAKQTSKYVDVTNSLLHFAVHGMHPQRRAVITAYIRIRLKILVGAIGRRKVKSSLVMGRDIRSADPHTISFLLMELFIKESYKGFASPRTIVDLGSNIGMSILLFKSLWPTSKIVGVEASPDIFALLQENTRGLPDVTVLNKAVSDQSEPIMFYSTPDKLTGSLNKLRGGGEGMLVDALPISEFITGPVDLLKIDIEGGEIAAFAELEKSGKMTMIRQMAIEYHHHIPGEKSNLASFLERLERCGFRYEIAAGMPQGDGGMQDILIRAKRI